MVWLIATSNTDYFTVTINDGTWETVCPLHVGDFSVDYLPTGTHFGSIEPKCSDCYTEPVHFEIRFKDNKKLELWQIIPQPGDEEYFNPDLLKVKVKK